MIKADMHMHSTVSDGSFTIPELICRAKQNGLDAIVITDHDTFSHAKQIPHNEDIKIAAGIEVSAFDYEKNFRVHLLGYNIRNSEIIEQFTHPTLEARHANSLKQIAILNEHGYEIDTDELRKADGKYIYKQHIMENLVKRNITPDMFGEFYYSTFKNNGICHFDIRYPSPLKALRAIKDSGGLAVLAHSGQQQNFSLIPELVKNGLDGLELNHHSHSDKDKAVIQEYAKKYNLFLTGGSDFHGIFEPVDVDLGDYISEQSGVEKIFGMQ